MSILKCFWKSERLALILEYEPRLRTHFSGVFWVPCGMKLRRAQWMELLALLQSMLRQPQDCKNEGVRQQQTPWSLVDVPYRSSNVCVVRRS